MAVDLFSLLYLWLSGQDMDKVGLSEVSSYMKTGL